MISRWRGKFSYKWKLYITLSACTILHCFNHLWKIEATKINLLQLDLVMLAMLFSMIEKQDCIKTFYTLVVSCIFINDYGYKLVFVPVLISHDLMIFVIFI